MAAKETGKERVARIELDHYKRHGALWWTKVLGAVLLAALATAWWAYGVWGRRDDAIYSRGPVSAAHALWENNCTVCHQEFGPMNERNWAASFVGIAPTKDESCRACHQGHFTQENGSQYTHHQNQKSDPNCGSCHREHRGRDASLTRLPDGDCTQCHKDLAAHRSGTQLEFETAIERFDRSVRDKRQAGEHPPFRVFDPAAGKRVGLSEIQGKDPGKLKFNHKLHMTAGLWPEVEPFRFKDIRDEQERARYWKQQQPGESVVDPDALVRLDCASCHRTEGGDFGSTRATDRGAVPARGTGAYMLPIDYEMHCRACHPLTFDRAQKNTAIPHRLQPDEVHKFLWGAHADRLASELRERIAPERRMPGRALGEAEEKARSTIQGSLRDIESFLYRDTLEKKERYVFAGKTSCGVCHVYERAEGKLLPTRIVPTAVPQVWFPHAKFDHTAHRAVDCRACHERAYPDSKDPKGQNNASSTEKDVLLPDIQTCVACHSPPRGAGATAQGGARFACTECHRYHNADQPLLGRGARARGARHELSLDHFLKGELPRKSEKPKGTR